MCIDHQRSASATFTPTIHRVPLRRPTRRWSRRTVLFNAGIGTAGMAILSACSGSDSSTSTDAGGDTTSPPATEPSATEPPSTEAPDGSVADAGAESDQATPDGAGAPLELTWVELGFVSAYVLVRGSEAAIVDTGVDGSGAAISEALAQLGLVPADVRHIVLTHNHGDHVGGLGELEVEMTNAVVSAGPGDVDSIRTGLTLQQVGDGDEVFGLGVVHTPGHTPGSISVFDTDTGLLVAGDAINGDGSGGVLGPNERFSSDMPTAQASVGVLADLAPTTIAFGHGGAPVDVDAASKLAAIA